MATLLYTSTAFGAVIDPLFVESAVATMGRGITGIAWPPDGSDRLFILKKAGQIYIVEKGVLLTTPFATITPITTTSECGLIGIAFDPDFVTNGYVYLFVTVSPTEQQIIRLTANGNVGVEKTVIVAKLPTLGENHDGGALGFGPDGKLYWAIGDNGSRLGADDDLALLASKVGRAERDGSVPSDNPFADGLGPNNDYVWARGFRNPFTLNFQPATGLLWLNVVGAGVEQVFALQGGEHGGWDNYASNQPAGYVLPVISYYTDGTTPFVVAADGAVRAGGMVTITTTKAHRMRPGAKVVVSGVTDSSFDTTAFVSAETALTLSYPQAGPDAVSGGGTMAPDDIGGAVTGGEFWDSSAVPSAYQGDFFFGDYNSGAVMRAQLGAGAQVTAVDHFGSGVSRIVDMALGPDGDMYYAGNIGTVFKARYVATQQGIVVSRLNLRMDEGGKTAFGVRLAVEPGGTRPVKAAWLSGDADISIVEGADLSFTAANWSTPQRVLLAAAHDVDALEDTATLRLTSSGVSSQTVTVRVTDDETFAIVVSPNELSVTEGGSAELEVSLTRAPLAPLVLSVERSAGDPSASVMSGTTLAIDTNNWATPQLVTVAAAQDADVSGGEATITISGDGLSSRDVSVTVHDDDESAPEITSTPATTAVIGANYTYDVEATGLPEPFFSLDAAPAGMTIDPTTGVIEWRPLLEQDESVTVRASNGVSPDALQAFDIDVTQDAPPTCRLKAPAEGEALSGPDAEFFGDVLDDVGAIGADFLVDGELVYEDANQEGHYHAGGSHNLFDTTQFSDGEHVLSLRGYDTAGQTCIAEVTVTFDNGGAFPGNEGDGGAGAGGDAGAGGSGTSVAEGGAGGSNGSTPAEAGVPATSDGGDASDAAPPHDASSSSDEGCTCRAAGAHHARSSLLGWLMVVVVARSRRRARPKPNG